MFNVGQHVKFQEGTTGAILHPDVEFTVVEVENELTLIAVVATAVATASWFNNLSMPALPDVSSWVQPGVELAIDIVSSLPKHAESASTAVISTAGDAASSVSDVLGSCASAVGDTIGSCAEVAGSVVEGAGEILGSIGDIL